MNPGFPPASGTPGYGEGTRFGVHLDLRSKIPDDGLKLSSGVRRASELSVKQGQECPGSAGVRNRCAKCVEGRIHSPRVGLYAERCRVERETGAGMPRVRWGAQQVREGCGGANLFAQGGFVRGAVPG